MHPTNRTFVRGNNGLPAGGPPPQKAHGSRTNKGGARRNANKKWAPRPPNAGRSLSPHPGFATPPVYHASTLLYPSAEDYIAHRGQYQYGRRGTPTSEA